MFLLCSCGERSRLLSFVAAPWAGSRVGPGDSCVEWWTEPILVEHELHVAPKRRRLLARIEFPRQIAGYGWACPFQVCGTGDRRRELGHGEIDKSLSIDG